MNAMNTSLNPIHLNLYKGNGLTRPQSDTETYYCSIIAVLAHTLR